MRVCWSKIHFRIHLIGRYVILFHMILGGRSILGVGKAELQQIADGIAIEGKSVATIARETGVCDRTIYRKLHSESFRTFLQTYQHDFIKDNLPDASKTYRDILKKKTGSKNSKIKLEASRDVMQASGVIPSREQSIYVQQIFNQTQIILSPVVKELLSKHGDSLRFGDDVIDVTPDGEGGSGT